MLKHCAHCNQDKPLMDFHRSHHTRLGVQTYCRSCRGDVKRAHKQMVRLLTKSIPATKHCPTCGHTKSSDDFCSDRTVRDGLSYQCTRCKSVSETARRKASGGLIGRKNHWWSFFRMRPADVQALRTEQDDRCWICRRSFKETRPFIDHCHATGAVRGVLCSRCNSSLKGIEDRIFFEKASAYLVHFKDVSPRFYLRKARALIDNESCQSSVTP